MSATEKDKLSEGHLCTREILAAGTVAVVERCRCGTLHLTLGALTLRLHEDALRSVSGTLAEVMEALVGRHDDRCEPLRPGILGALFRGTS